MTSSAVNASSNKIPLIHKLIKRGMIQSITVPQQKPGSGNVIMHRRSPDLRLKESWEHRYMPKILDVAGKLDEVKPAVYCGFDPTADSLHLGHLTTISLLLRLAHSGFKVIALVGGATSVLGDPSGKTESRQKADKKDLLENAECLEAQLQGVFSRFSAIHKIDSDNFIILNNHVWYENLSVKEFTEKIANQFKLTEMLDRRVVRSRLEDGGNGITFQEFVYQTFQSYDWFNLYKKYQCAIQVGGHDQIGNIEDGYEFVWRRLSQRPDLAGITVPLVVTKEGEKLGKSAGNAIWLDPNKTTPEEMKNYMHNLSLEDLRDITGKLTFLPLDQIQGVSKEEILPSLMDSVSSLIY